MLGVGIDAADIERFSHWHTYNNKSLLRIFNPPELEYCLSVPAKAAERFAARWAAKEACYKALNRFFSEKITYSYFCKQVTVIATSQSPQLLIDWQHLRLNRTIQAPEIHFSLTHTKHTAIALVILT